MIYIYADNEIQKLKEQLNIYQSVMKEAGITSCLHDNKKISFTLPSK